jgi:hypothetical protein
MSQYNPPDLDIFTILVGASTMYDTSMHVPSAEEFVPTEHDLREALFETQKRLCEIEERVEHMDGYQETGELFEIGSVLGVSDDMGRSPNGERPGPEHGDILAAVKVLNEQKTDAHDLLRDCLRALNRLDAYEGLCDQIRRVLYGKEGEE